MKNLIDLLEHGTVKLETGYQVPLLWKGDPRLQNKRQVALKRLKGLKRQFKRDPAYEKDHRKAIWKYVKNGYAVKINQYDLNRLHQWYLLHYGTTEKKLWVVFDAAAKYNEKLLNYAFLPGPALQN